MDYYKPAWLFQMWQGCYEVIHREFLPQSAPPPSLSSRHHYPFARLKPSVTVPGFPSPTTASECQCQPGCICPPTQQNQKFITHSSDIFFFLDTTLVPNQKQYDDFWHMKSHLNHI